jgi:predicted PurR-regulated permease PerM
MDPASDGTDPGAVADAATAAALDRVAATAFTTRARSQSMSRAALSILAVIALVAALYLAGHHLPRPIGAALVLAALMGSLSWVGYALSDDAAAMIETLPEAARKLRQNMTDARADGKSPLQNMQDAANEIQGAASDAGLKPGARPSPVRAPETSTWVRDYAIAQSGLLIAIAAQTPIVLLLAYFLLASGVHFRRKLVQFVGPTLSRKKDTVRILEEVDVQIQRYLLATLLSKALVGIGTWLAFEALGMKHAGVWGVAAGVLHFIPYLGSTLTILAAGVAAFLQFGSVLHALAIAGVTLLVAASIGLVFMTWLQSRAARINPAVLFIALLFFGWLWGISGLLLGAPLVAIVKVICDRVDTLNPVGELLGR